MRRLPKILAREPLIDAVFEMRASGVPNLADVLPGILFSQINPKPQFRRLSTAEIPQAFRLNDPNLAFSPLVQLELEQFLISFGDRNVVVSCKMPYPKWPAFNEFIIQVIAMIGASGIPIVIERYSLKYVNVIEAPTISEQIKKIVINLKIGDVELGDDPATVQLHRRETGTLHILSVMTGAIARLFDGCTVSGTILDIDSIREVSFPSFSEFEQSIKSDIQSLRAENKSKFLTA